MPGDITDMANVAQAVMVHKPDAVVHCAAIVGVLSSLGSPINVVRVNVEGSLNVFEAMRLAGVRRCIHLSSEEAYGAFRADRIDETHPLDPVLPYGICKAAVEQLGRSYRDLHGLEVINLRTSWVYGPGLPRNRIPKNLVDAALVGRKLHIPAGADSAIDHTHVDDLVSGVLKALDHEHHRFDAYNIASGAGDHRCRVGRHRPGAGTRRGALGGARRLPSRRPGGDGAQGCARRQPCRRRARLEAALRHSYRARRVRECAAGGGAANEGDTDGPKRPEEGQSRDTTRRQRDVGRAARSLRRRLLQDAGASRALRLEDPRLPRSRCTSRRPT